MSWPITMHWHKDWRDITDDVDVEDAPWTLAKPDGVGALQFSVMLYQSGVKPDPGSDLLLKLLLDFGDQESLGVAYDIVREEFPLRLAAASYERGGEFVRAWYVSDGWNFAKITYVSLVGEADTELTECEQMIRTLQFAN